MYPKISVVTIVFNDVDHIEKTILSVLNQSYSNIEYIVIDGNSTDGTVEIIKKYDRQISYWISEPDRGIYDAMNKGIIQATGTWINFMNSGDWFYDNNVLDKIFFNRTYSGIGIIYGSVEFRFFDKKNIQNPKPLTYLTKGMAFSHQASFVRLSLMKQYLYNLKYKIVADYDFFLKQYTINTKFFCTPIVIASFDKLSGISASPSFKIYKLHIAELMEIERTYKMDTNYRFTYRALYFRFVLKLIILRIIPQKMWVNFLRKRNK